MNNIYKYGFKFLTTHLLSVAISFFFTFAFGWLIEKAGMYYFSILTSLIYVGLIYSDAWNYGRLEAKPYNDIKSTPIHALLSSIIPSLVGAVFLLLVNFNISVTSVSIITKVWYAMFIGFYNTSSITILEIICSIAVIPVVSFIGYFVGTKNFSLLENYGAYKHKRLIAKKQKVDAQREARRKERLGNK